VIGTARDTEAGASTSSSGVLRTPRDYDWRTDGDPKGLYAKARVGRDHLTQPGIYVPYHRPKNPAAGADAGAHASLLAGTWVIESAGSKGVTRS